MGGAVHPVKKKTAFEPLPKYDNKSATDYQEQAFNITKLPEWRNSYNFNPDDYERSQTNFEQAWKEICKEMEIPDRANQKKQI